MKIEQSRWTEKKGWESVIFGHLGDAAQLAFVFGSTTLLKNPTIRNHVRKAYPRLFSWDVPRLEKFAELK